MTEVTKGMCCENGQAVIKIIVNNYSAEWRGFC